MSCSIPKETKGFIDITAGQWDEFVDYVRENFTDVYITDDQIRFDDINAIGSLAPKFISYNQYGDLMTYCDVAEMNMC
jgi:hypothetical protein